MQHVHRYKKIRKPQDYFKFTNIAFKICGLLKYIFEITNFPKKNQHRSLYTPYAYALPTVAAISVRVLRNLYSSSEAYYKGGKLRFIPYSLGTKREEQKKNV